MKPQVAVFTKDNPCTKIHIWNCFRGQRGFRRAQVDEARAVIGANAPRGMIAQGRLERVSKGNVDYYQLTEAGKKWLYQGMQNYLRNHPDRRPEAQSLPVSMSA
jgi:hypothetical protein